MNDLWLKIKGWTKALLFSCILVYAVLFIFKNSGKPVDFWWWFNHVHSTSVFLLTSGAFAAGMVFAAVVLTLLRTLRQLRQSSVTRRLDRIERDRASENAKAAMLQTRPISAVGATTPVGTGEGLTMQVDRLGNKS